MKLSEIVKIRKETEVKGVKVPWDGKGECVFLLSYTGRGILSRARRQSLDRKFNHKTHKIDENIDEDKFDYEVLKETVLGWWGLKGKHLKEILDPSRVDLKLSDVELETEIPFTEENRDVIIRNYNLTFNTFITSVSTDIEVYRQYKTEELGKNLGTSQSGAKEAE